MDFKKLIKKYPDAIWIMPILFTTIFFQIMIAIDSMYQIMPITEDAIQVMLTGAEVVAGLYGLTFTGYIFFMDYLQEQIQEDDLISEVVILLKTRYYKIILVISVYTFIAIVMAMLLNFFGLETSYLSERIVRFLMSETLFLMLSIVAFIIYFVLDIINPKKMARISLQYKELLEAAEDEANGKIDEEEIDEEEIDEIEGNTQLEKEIKSIEAVERRKNQEIIKETTKRTEGNLQEFLQDYKEIEELLMVEYKSFAQNQIQRNLGKPIRFKDTLILLKGFNESLFLKTTRLHQYYSYMVFSNEATVSKKMCQLAKEVKAELIKIKKEEKGVDI